MSAVAIDERSAVKRQARKALSAATCDWYEMRTKLWDAIEEKLGYPSLAFFEQLVWKSHDTGRCAECGDPGAVKHEKPTLAQAVPYYWLCQACDDYYERR